MDRIAGSGAGNGKRDNEEAGKMNKQQLKDQIVKLTSEYLGFTVDGVHGLSSMTKPQLEQEIQEIKRALRFKKYSKKIKIDRLHGYFAPQGSVLHNQFIRLSLIESLAERLWHKTPYDKAKAEARKNVLG